MTQLNNQRVNNKNLLYNVTVILCIPSKNKPNKAFVSINIHYCHSFHGSGKAFDGHSS